MIPVRTLVGVVVLINLIGLIHIPSAASELSGRAACAIAPPATASDTFFGRGVRGPYVLSWKPFDLFSERVFVDGIIVQRGVDYDADPDAGVIVFREPIATESYVRVVYSLNPNVATRNASPLNVPLSLNLLKKGDTALRLVGLYKQAPDNAQPASDVVVYGLSGDAKFSKSHVTSMFLLSPNQSSDSNNRLDDRSAMKLSGTANTGALRLDASYLRVGRRFTGARDYSFTPGVDMLNISTAFGSGKTVAFTSNLKTSETDTGSAVKIESSAEHKLVFSPVGAPKLTLFRSEIEKGTVGQSTKTTTDTVSLEHSITPQINTSASYRAVVTDTAGVETRQAVSEIALSATPRDDLTLKSVFTQKESSQAGGESKIAFGVDTKPLQNLSVSAGASRVESDVSGETTTENIKVTATPISAVDVQLDLAHKDTEAAGSEVAHTLKVVSKPFDTVQLEVGVVGVNAERPADESARSARILTTALPRTSLTIDWRESESELKGDEDFKAFRVETSPSSAIKLSAVLGRREASATREFTREAALELVPFTHTRLAGSIREIKSNGMLSSRVTDFSLRTKPLEFLELSGEYKAREAFDKETLESVNLGLVLDTGSAIKLTGTYISNPEDKIGTVQRLTSQSFGLKTDLGKLNLTGAYALKNQYLAGDFIRSAEVTLDYRLSSRSKLTTGYGLDKRLGASYQETSIYSIGYTHKVGSRFDLYLGGKFYTRDGNQPLADVSDDYQAEAKLGIKF